MSSSNANIAKHEFISHHSGVDENEFTITVWFSRDPEDESSLDGLLLQRGLDVENDTPGIDGVYVEIPIQQHVVYGGITEARLGRGDFTVRINDAAARDMAGFHEILVHFDLSDEEFTSIREALRFVFTGCSCYRDDHETAA